MSLEELKNRLFGKSEEDQIIESLYIVMKEFGYTIQELNEMPLPTLKMILHLIEKEYKSYKNKIPRFKKW